MLYSSLLQSEGKKTPQAPLCILFYSSPCSEMFKGNKKITTAAMEMTEMRALIEKLFGELNARLEKFDQTIQEMKESLQVQYKTLWG